MNKEQLITRRAELATLFRDGGLSREDFLAELDALTTASRNPWFAFLNELESLFALLRHAEGEPKRIHYVIDLMTSRLVKYDETLPNEEVSK
jgi:hypothetical protein